MFAHGCNNNVEAPPLQRLFFQRRINLSKVRSPDARARDFRRDTHTAILLIPAHENTLLFPAALRAWNAWRSRIRVPFLSASPRPAERGNALRPHLETFQEKALVRTSRRYNVTLLRRTRRSAGRVGFSSGPSVGVAAAARGSPFFRDSHGSLLYLAVFVVTYFFRRAPSVTDWPANIFTNLEFIFCCLLDFQR